MHIIAYNCEVLGVVLCLSFGKAVINIALNSKTTFYTDSSFRYFRYEYTRFVQYAFSLIPEQI